MERSRIIRMAAVLVVLAAVIATESQNATTRIHGVRSSVSIDLNPRHNRPAGSQANELRPPALRENSELMAGLGSTTTSPGMRLAETFDDVQSVDAVPHQIACNSGSPFVHMAWNQAGIISESLNCGDRTANFRTYKSATGAFLYPVDGVSLSGSRCDWLHGGMLSLDIDDSDRACMVFNQGTWRVPPWTNDYSSWFVRQNAPDSPSFLKDSLRGSQGSPAEYDGYAWPHVTVDQIPGTDDVIHVVAHAFSADAIVYWRFKATDMPQWQGPVVIDSSGPLSYNVAADRTSDKAALITIDEYITAGNPHGLRQVTCRESPDNGASWLNGTGLGDMHEVFITHYNDPAGPASWFECVGDYDNTGNLHVVWNEKRFARDSTSLQSAWKHWDRLTGATSTIHAAYYDNPGLGGVRRLNIGLPSIGFGDGSTLCDGSSNQNCVYMTFVQFGGPSPEQQADVSANGYMNGDIYLSISADGGRLWAPARNLTNTRSPGCDYRNGGSCLSENRPSIARTVDDTIHIMYMVDRDAGDANCGEGGWTLNPMLYYRIPGSTNGDLCPEIAPVLDYQLTDTTIAPLRMAVSTATARNLEINNYGNALLSGAVSVVYTNPPVPPVNWLSVGGAQTQSYSIVAGTPGIKWLVVASNQDLDSGLYRAELRITHNDPHRANPTIVPVSINGPSCICLSQGDLNSDGVLDVFDVISGIEIAFEGFTDPRDHLCPASRTDVNNDGRTDVFDVVYLIATTFGSGPSPVNPCTP